MEEETPLNGYFQSLNCCSYFYPPASWRTLLQKLSSCKMQRGCSARRIWPSSRLWRRKPAITLLRGSRSHSAQQASRPICKEHRRERSLVMTYTCNNNRQLCKRETLENYTENALKSLQHVSLKHFTGIILPCTDSWNYRDSVGRKSSNREEGYKRYQECRDFRQTHCVCRHGGLRTGSILTTADPNCAS